MTGQPLACVIGDMDLVRPLGLAGVPVAAVTAQPDAATRFSRFCSAVVDWPHPADDEDGAVSALLEFGRRQPTPPVLFCQGDTDLLLASRRRSELEPCFLLTLAPEAMVEDLVDKLRFAELARCRDLPVPSTRILRRGATASELRAAADDLRFPCALKPVTRRKWTGFRAGGPAGGGVPKAARLERPGDLLGLQADLDRLDTDFLLQEFVPGGEEEIVSYHAFVAADGSTAGEFTGRKVRTYPLECGFTTALEITAAPDVRELGREVLRRIDYRGVVKIDFKRHSVTGELLLLELNPRFNLWHHPGALAGVNLPYLAYCQATGQEVPAAGPARAGVRWSWFWKDLAACRGLPGSRLRALWNWAAFTTSAEAHSVFAWDDPGPFFRGVLLRAVGRATRRGSARVGRPDGPPDRAIVAAPADR